jgi:hypothetical protein
VAQLIERRDAFLDGGATSDHQHPDRFDVAGARLRRAPRRARQRCSSRRHGIQRVGLASSMAGLTVRAIDLNDLDARPLQLSGEARAIRAGALDAHQHHRAQRAQPPDETAIARFGRRERLDAQHTAHDVNRRRHMHIQVRVHAADHATGGLYDGHGHPFCRSVKGVARTRRDGDQDPGPVITKPASSPPDR